MTEIRLASVNIGQSENISIGKKTIETGIFKNPVRNKVRVTPEGLETDIIADKERHGGKDQAVYIYSLEDYAWWSKELDHELAVGTFGENLTITGLCGSAIRIGDRLKINDVLMEVTFARIPCATLGARMKNQSFIKRFVREKRTGVYLRVLIPGELQVGDLINYIPTNEKHPLVTELFDLWYAKERCPDLLQKGLKAPIAARAREVFEYLINE